MSTACLAAQRARPSAIAIKHGSARRAQLLTVQVLAGLVVMVVVSLPLAATFDMMFRVMTVVEIFCVPALVLLQVLHIYSYQSHLQLYAQRIRSAKLLQTTALTRKGVEIDAEAEKAAKELEKRVKATKARPSPSVALRRCAVARVRCAHVSALSRLSRRVCVESSGV